MGLGLAGMGSIDIEPAKISLIGGTDVMPGGAAEADKPAETEDPENADNIGMLVLKSFQVSLDSRHNAHEDILLASERAYRNKYSMPAQTELATREVETGDSTIWVPYTRTKTNIAVAKTYEKLINTNTRPWAIQPDAITSREMDRNRIDIEKARLTGILTEDPKTALEKLNEFDRLEMKDRCEAMESEIAEQMNVGDVGSIFAKVILQQHYLGLGVAKFEIGVRTDNKWEEVLPGSWELVAHEIPHPFTRFVDLFDIFFDPYALSRGRMLYIIERHVLRRSDLLAFKSSQDFKEDKISELIKNNPDGNHIDLDYETAIRGINEQDQNSRGSEGYYDVFEYWGEVGGDKLINYGATVLNGIVIEETQSYSCQCWVCAGVTFKLIVNPHQPEVLPYLPVPYQENTHTIYGTGIPEELFGVQEVLNSVTRATIDNAAFAHAPITEINTDMLVSGQEAPDVLKARQIFLREGGDPKEPMVRFYQPTENSQVLYNVYDMFNKIGEDATGISGSSEESLPASNTGQGSVSMTLTQKNILQRTVVSNIDMHLIKPLVEMYYNFNMRFNEKQEIKSAAHVKANGVVSILAKEMQAQQLMAFAQLTASPEDRALVNRKGVLGELATSLDQDPEKIIYTDSQAQENTKANSDAQMQSAKMEQEGVIAQIDAENRGELEQDRLKGENDLRKQQAVDQANMRKQQLIERSKMQQLAAKEDIDISEREWELIKELQVMRQQQSDSMRNSAQNARISDNSAILGNKLAMRQAQQAQQGNVIQNQPNGNQ